MNPNILPTERFSLEGVISPQSVDGATVSSPWISMAQLGYLCAIVAAGAIADTGTLDGAFVQATSAAGAGEKAVTGKSMTQLLTANDDDQVFFNVSEDDLDTANGFTHVQLQLTAATAASLVSAVLLGFDANYSPKAHGGDVVETV
jgi:hypothetical protein